MGENIIQALSSIDLWTAIVKSIVIILVGFFLTKVKVLKEDTPKVLTKIVLNIALPCLAFSSFMTDITNEKFNSALFSFIWGFVIYILFIILSKGIFKFEKNKSKRIVLEMLFVFGSTTFFGQPLILAVFPNAYNDSSLFNIAYRVFMYSYAYIMIKDIKFDKTHIKPTLKKIFLNPIIVATFIGLVLWILQLLPGSLDISNWWVINKNSEIACFWRIDKTLSPIYYTIKTLGDLASPLVWIAIGATLAKTNIKEAAHDKDVWIYTLIKIVFAPVLNLLLLLIVNLFIDVSFTTLAATTLMLAVPPATIVVGYCIDADKEALFSSDCSLIGTIVAVCFIPIYIIFLTLINTCNIFK